MRDLPKNVTRMAPATPAPKSALAVLEDRFGDLGRLVARRNSERTTSAISRMTEIPGMTERSRERALKRAETLPPLEQLWADRDALHAAVYTPATEPEARAILGIMLEAIPNAATQATQGYGDALAYAVLHADDDRDPERLPRYRGHSAAILFATVRAIWASCRFTPSIAEVLETAAKVRSQYWSALASTSRLVALAENVTDIIALTTPLPEGATHDWDDVPF